MKSSIIAAALAAALVPSYSLAQGQDDCWGPAELSASAPDFESRDSIRMLTKEDTAILLAVATQHKKHPAAGIVTIYSARRSGDAAKVLIFAFNDPATNDDKKQLPFNKDDPFKELGIRQVAAKGGGDIAMLDINDVVLTKAEFSGLSGMQQMIKDNGVIGGGTSNDSD